MIYLPQLPQFEDAGMRGKSRLFRILQPLAFGNIVAPAGFVTDGASIPRMFWPIFGPHGSYFGAAIVHDYLYSPANTYMSRKEADQVFLQAMIRCGVGVATRQLVYRAVRVGGMFAFRGQIK
jgi:hypothetical protein